MVIQTALANPYPQSVTGFVRQAEAVLSHDTLARLAGRGAPTLVSVGEDDALVPPRFSRELAAGFRGARLQLVPRAGHVNYWERADAFNALALEFIEAHRDA
jgi:pimeloyl-ACP methyl ester carboxylesterase